MNAVVETHVFVCTNQKSNGACCAQRGGAEFRDRLKKLARQAAADQDPRFAQVRINASGCLGQCENGIAAVIYPSGKWFVDLKAGEEPNLLREIELLFDRP